MDFSEFLEIYYDPVWEEEGDLVPSDFDVDELYQETLQELENTYDGYVAVQIAMEQLADLVEYSYRPNPQDYSQMSLGQLKREERRLLETIDDDRYFGRDPARIEQLEQELNAVRRAMGEESIHLSASKISSDSPEFAVQEQLNVLHAEEKTLRNLEAEARSIGDLGKVHQFRTKKLAVSDTMQHIAPLLSQNMAYRKVEAATEQKIQEVTTALRKTIADLQALSPKISSATLDEQLRLNKTAEQLTDTRKTQESTIYRLNQELRDIRKAIDKNFTIIYRDFDNIGYGIASVQAAPQASTATPQIIFQSGPVLPPLPASEVNLPSELTRVYQVLSSDPITRELQGKLERAVQEFIAATNDQEPPFILAKIRDRMAKLHEQITQRTANQ